MRMSDRSLQRRFQFDDIMFRFRYTRVDQVAKTA